MNSTKQERCQKKRVLVRAFAIGCLLVVIVVCGLFVTFRKNYLGEEYQGRKLVEWAEDLSFGNEETIEDLTARSNVERYEAAVKAVRHFGTNALPLALRLCRAKNSTLELKLMSLCDDFNSKQSKYHLDHDISEAENKWRTGLNIFCVLGSNAAPAIPTLIEYLNRDSSAAAENATVAFRYVGSDSIPPLLVALTNSNKQTKRLAAFSLSHFGTNSVSATPVLIQYMRGERGALADMAAHSLAKINDDPTVVVPALTQYLKTTADMPYSAIFSKLGSFGTNAASATPVLIEMIESNRRLGLIPHVISALIQIDPERGNYYRTKRESDFINNSVSPAKYGQTNQPASHN